MVPKGVMPKESKLGSTTSTKTLSNSSGLFIYPPQVEFEGVDYDFSYLMNISIRNTSTVMKRIRISSTNTSYFRMRYDPAPALAPGLDMKAEIEFVIPSDADNSSENEEQLIYEDFIYVMTDEERIRIPLRACRPRPSLTFDSFCNLGLVRTIIHWILFL